MKVGIAITDVLTGMYASLAISAAITHVEHTGQGQYIDAALLDTIVAFNANQVVSYLASGKIPQRWGNDNPHLVPYQVLNCKGGQVMVSVGNDYQWGKFCVALGVPELVLFAPIAGAVAVAVERPNLKHVDDDFLMFVVPLLALAALSLAV